MVSTALARSLIKPRSGINQLAPSVPFNRINYFFYD